MWSGGPSSRASSSASIPSHLLRSFRASRRENQMSRACAHLTLAASSIVLGLVGVLAVAGCKGSTKDSPQTLAKLSDCETRAAKLDEKDKLIQSYEAEIARLKLESNSGNQQYTFAIDGDALTIKAKPQ